MPFPCCPLQDAGVGEHGPEVRDELPAFGQVLDVCLRVVGRRDVQDRLRPELCHDHLPPQPGVELLRLPSQPDPLSKGSLITLGR